MQGCSRPQDQEYTQVALATLIGFATVGVTGYVVKFMHIPITAILIGGK